MNFFPSSTASTRAWVVSSSRPVKTVGPQASRMRWYSTCSSRTPVRFFAARPLAFWSAMSAWNPSMSRPYPRSFRISWVTSSGNPYVSWSWNATVPETWAPRFEAGQLVLQDRQAGHQRAPELGFLTFEDPQHQLAVGGDLGVGRAHGRRSRGRPWSA